LENIGPSYSLYLENIGYRTLRILDTELGKYWILNLEYIGYKTWRSILLNLHSPTPVQTGPYVVVYKRAVQ